MIQTKETEGAREGQLKDPVFRFQTSEGAVDGEAARQHLSESRKHTGCVVALESEIGESNDQEYLSLSPLPSVLWGLLTTGQPFMPGSAGPWAGRHEAEAVRTRGSGSRSGGANWLVTAQAPSLGFLQPGPPGRTWGPSDCGRGHVRPRWGLTNFSDSWYV